MRSDYRAALKLGEAAVKEAQKNGMSPYLPVLDSIDGVNNTLKQSYLGLMELPLYRIKGNKEAARNNAFANNFMPILRDGTEFAQKWSGLYDSYVKEGIRDAIKVYEYMHDYYVQEGNKRVSVSIYGKSEYILADVTRILPEKSDAKEVKAYYEYLDFYAVTKNFSIVLTEPGQYEKLANLLGQNLKDPWPDELRSKLNAAYISFEKKCIKILKADSSFKFGDAFLIYISIFPMKSLITDSDETVIRQIKMVREELLSGSDIENITFLDKTSSDGASKRSKGGLLGLLGKSKKYTSASPLRVAFIYDDDPDDSRWIDSHEAGRLYLDEMTGDDVVTVSYQTGRSDEELETVLEQAVADKNELIFTVSESMMSQTVKTAVKHPEVRFLNCSIGQTSSTVRCYYGRLYEASFLAGILAGDILLKNSDAKAEKKIGCLVGNLGNLSMANINAFAIGASLIDPDIKISMQYCRTSGHFDYMEVWKQEGVTMYADMEYSVRAEGRNRPGLFLIGDEKNTYLGAPYYKWGKYYLQIVQSVLFGEWDLRESKENPAIANYWFGLSSGVVDLRVAKIPYQTKKLLAFFKGAIITGGMSPFSGELHSQSKTVQDPLSSSENSVSMLFDTIPDSKIVRMDWMNENII